MRPQFQGIQTCGRQPDSYINHFQTLYLSLATGDVGLALPFTLTHMLTGTAHFRARHGFSTATAAPTWDEVAALL
jgi:hypothetical protein